MTADDLRDMIHKVFPITSAPAATEALQSPWPLDLERDALRQAFGGRRWDEVSVPMLVQHRQGLFFFSPEGWAYYLPAYMLAAIDSYDEVDTVLTEITDSLTPGGDAEIAKIIRARLRALTDLKLRVLLSFVEWAAHAHPDDVDDDSRTAIGNGVLREIQSRSSADFP